MGPKSPYRRACLVPRCRLITSWSCRRFQGLGCSPIKVVRELGLERRETVCPYLPWMIENCLTRTFVREEQEGKTYCQIVVFATGIAMKLRLNFRTTEVIWSGKMILKEFSKSSWRWQLIITVFSLKKYIF